MSIVKFLIKLINGHLAFSYDNGCANKEIVIILQI